MVSNVHVLPFIGSGRTNQSILMSIINNVLKDLESRSSQFTAIDVTSTGTTAVSRLRHFLPSILAFLLLVAIGIVFWFYQASQHDSDVVSDKKSKEVQINKQRLVEGFSVLPVADVQKSSNQIIGMQLRESDKTISLEFSLREKVVSYLKERSEKRIVYHLKDIQSDIVSPVIRDNRWIEQLVMSVQADGVDINLITAANVLVETQQQRLGEEIVWAITLSKLLAPEVIVPVISVQKNQAVKVEAKTQPDESMSDTGNAGLETKVVKLEIISRDTHSDVLRQLKSAQAFIKQKQFDLAEPILSGLLGSTQDLVAREFLLIVYKRNKNTSRLNELVTASMKRYPQNLIFKTRHAQSLFQLKDYQSVIDFLQIQADLNAMQLALIGASYQRLDQHQPAADFYRQSLRIEASHPRNWIALGLSEEHNANSLQAFSAYRSASKQGGLNSKLTEFVEQRISILEKVIN
jgi:predicted negative regulator of RcsB-dependent stress response